MKAIYNTQTKVADLIQESSTIPEGWTDQKPNWTEFEVWDNGWVESEELKVQSIKNKRIAEIKAECDLLDAKSIRPMRNKEVDKIAEIEKQLTILRKELKVLEK